MYPTPARGSKVISLYHGNIFQGKRLFLVRSGNHLPLTVFTGLTPLLEPLLCYEPQGVDTARQVHEKTQDDVDKQVFTDPFF
jgi:hypothetical protein